MTDAVEEAFQARLDADPSDALTRLVLADHLDERGDPRAAGYRRLAELSRVPRWTEPWPSMSLPACWTYVGDGNVWAWTGAFFGTGGLHSFALPDRWAKRMTTDPALEARTNTAAGRREWTTRRRAEDEAALAYRPGD